MRPVTFFGIFVSLAHLAIADVTVDEIAPATTPVASGVTFPTPAASISLVGVTSLSVLPNGATVYAETEVETQFAFISGTSTLTLLSMPTTIIATFAEDASVYSISEAVTTTLSGNEIVVGNELVCSGTSGAEVTCVQENVQSAGGQVQTGTVTFSAVRAPAFTIKTSGARAQLLATMIYFMAAVGLVCGRLLGSMY